MERANKNAGRKPKFRILPVLVIVCLVTAGGLFYYHGQQGKKNKESVEKPEIDPSAGEYQPPIRSTTAIQGVAIPGWGQIYMNEGKTGVEVDFYNPEENDGRYYLSFELRLPEMDGSYEILYKSGLVKPGLHIQHIELSRPMDAGTYEAVLHVQPYRMDEDKTPTNNADMKTSLIVA